MCTFINETDKEEQRTGGDAVVEHLYDRAVRAVFVKCKKPQRDKTHMADARIGDQLFNIFLR